MGQIKDQKKININKNINLFMNNEIKDFVVDKDVKCPLCGGEMKKSRTIKGKTIFKCNICGYEIQI